MEQHVHTSNNEPHQIDDSSVTIVIEQISQIPGKKKLAQEIQNLYKQLKKGKAVDQATLNPVVQKVGATLTNLDDVGTIVNFRKTLFGLSERITMQNFFS